LCAFKRPYVQEATRHVIRSLSDTFDIANRLSTLKRIVHLCHEHSFPPFRTLVGILHTEFDFGKTTAEKNVIVAQALRLVEKQTGTERVYPLPRARALLGFQADLDLSVSEKLFFLKQLIYEDGDFFLTFLQCVKEFGLARGSLPEFQVHYFAALKALLMAKLEQIQTNVSDQYLKQNFLRRRTVGVYERLKSLEAEHAKTRGHRTRSRLGWLQDLGLLYERNARFIVTDQGDRLIEQMKASCLTHQSSDGAVYSMIPIDSDLRERLSIADLGPPFDRQVLNGIAVQSLIGKTQSITLDDKKFLELLWNGYQKTQLPLFEMVELETLEEYVSDALGSVGQVLDFHEHLRRSCTSQSPYVDLLSKVRGGEGILKFKKRPDWIMEST
jgi:hypothetical protein